MAVGLLFYLEAKFRNESPMSVMTSSLNEPFQHRASGDRERAEGRSSGVKMDHDVSFNCVAAWTCWLLAGIGAAADICWGLPQIRLLGVMCVGAGATLHVRMFVHRMDERERNAFELGRDMDLRRVK